MYDGASPQKACEELGVSYESARLTYMLDQRFRQRLDNALESRTDNVLTKTYHEAMKGKVTAQSLWLREEAARRVRQASEQAELPEELSDRLDRLRSSADQVSPERER